MNFKYSEHFFKDNSVEAKKERFEQDNNKITWDVGIVNNCDYSRMEISQEQTEAIKTAIKEQELGEAQENKITLGSVQETKKIPNAIPPKVSMCHSLYSRELNENGRVRNEFLIHRKHLEKILKETSMIKHLERKKEAGRERMPDVLPKESTQCRLIRNGGLTVEDGQGNDISEEVIICERKFILEAKITYLISKKSSLERDLNGIIEKYHEDKFNLDDDIKFLEGELRNIKSSQETFVAGAAIAANAGLMVTTSGCLIPVIKDI